MEKNQLYYGDNLEVMRRYIPNESVDLVYLDPPFNSNATYNVLFAEQDGSRSSAQIEAFGDTWRWDESAVDAFQSTVVRGGPVSDALRAFYTLLGDSNMMAYIAMMAPRLVELRRVLKPDGSLYLHCDPTASHYLKLLLDAVFGPHRFRSQITWQRTNAHSDSKDWSEVSDILLYFVKGERYTWNPTYQKHSDEYVASKYRYRDADGRIYRLGDMTSPSPRPNMMYEWKGHASPPLGWRYSKETMARLDAENRIWYPDDKKKRPQLKRYLDQMAGTLLTNIWTDIDPLNSQARERLGYPTQKPEALLDRILKASSNEGDVVLDPFCGCGTAVASAQRLGRRWIGIDITHLAINLIKSRLRDTHGDEVTQTYEVIGEPTTVSGARALAIQDRYQFQWWALGLVGARLAEVKKGADKGIDGRLFFYDDHGTPKQIILSVKSGGVSVKDVRELQAVIDREKAAIGALITLEPSTTPMRVEAAGSGRYEAAGWGSSHPRLQVVTIAELLAGKRLDYPAAGQRGATYKEAPRLRAAGGSQAALPLGD